MTFASDQIHSAKHALGNIKNGNRFLCFFISALTVADGGANLRFCRAREKHYQASFQQFRIKRARLLIIVGGGS